MECVVVGKTGVGTFVVWIRQNIDIVLIYEKVVQRKPYSHFGR